MKSSKRSFFILLALVLAIFYGTSLVVSSTIVPLHEKEAASPEKNYLRSLQLRLFEAVREKRFAEAEIYFRRINKSGTPSAMVRRLGSVALYRNGKLNEAEKLLHNLLLRNPSDFICRNNYAMALMARGQMQAVAELVKACKDSGRSPFIEKNLQRCAARFKVELPAAVKNPAEGAPLLTGVPVDAVTFEEEKK